MKTKWMLLIAGVTLLAASEMIFAEEPTYPNSKVVIYPILVQAPIFGATLDLPSLPNGGGGGDGGAISGSTDSSFEGAFMAGFSVQRPDWFIDTSGLWAGLDAERTSPRVVVDSDVIYFEAIGGWRFYKNLAITGGLRRIAVDLNGDLGQNFQFHTKPGIWDPLIGIDWRRQLSPSWALYLNGQGGGFGVGSDVDFSAAAKADWQFAKHFLLEVGYTYLYFKVKIADVTVGRFQREVILKESLNGPRFGLGIVF
jgi:hypothetical protein